MSQDIKRDEIRGGRILGIDYGEKRIGIAVSDPTLTIAQSLVVLENDFNFFQTLKDYCKKFDVRLIVVGFPVNLNGTYSKKTKEVINFAEKLEREIGIKVVRWDERLTTKIAQRSKIEMNMKKKKRRNKAVDDAISSVLILQSFLDYLKNKEELPERC